MTLEIAPSDHGDAQPLTAPEPAFSDEFAAFIEDCKTDYQGPCLLFDLTQVKRRIRAAKALEDQFNCRFLFAVKACPDAEVLRLFCDENIGFDVSNQGEYERLMALGDDISNRLISVTGPAMAFTESPCRADLFNVESRAQLAALQSMMPEAARYALRVRGESLHSDSGAKTGRFGFIDIESEWLQDRLNDPRFTGLHCSRSGRKRPLDFVRQARYLSDIADRIGMRLEFVNLGAGSDLLTQQGLEFLLTEIRRFLPRQTEILFEFGSYWFSGLGVAITKVVSVVNQPDDTRRIIVDISNEAHLRWSLIDRILSDDAETAQTIRLEGPTCLETDVLCNLKTSRHRNTPYEAGDRLVLFPLDIYSLNWNSAFNGIPEASVHFYGL